MIWDRHGSEQCRFQRPDSPRRSVCRSHTLLGSSHAMRCSQRQKPTQRHAERAQEHSTQAGSTADLEHVQPTVAPRACDPLRETMPAHQYRLSRDFRARQEPSGTADRSTSMNLPRMTAKTAIGVVGEDVVGSLQLAPSMDSISFSASTSPLNFSTTSSVPRPPSRTPKKRRHLAQRDDHAGAERPDPAFERPLPPIRLRPLFWIGARTTRLGGLVGGT